MKTDSNSGAGRPDTDEYNRGAAFPAGTTPTREAPELRAVRHAFKRLQAGIASKAAFTVKAQSIMKRHGNGAPNCSNLDPKCYPAVLIAAREALALDLAAFAPIFPLRPDSKVPYAKRNKKGPGGHLLATRDPKQIRAWVGEQPNCNWGLRGGDPSAADIDTKKGKQGAATWESLVKEHGRSRRLAARGRGHSMIHHRLGTNSRPDQAS